MAVVSDGSSLGVMGVDRKSGDERFQDDDEVLDFNLLDFWQWASSDLVSNAMRGRVAEFLVAQALGVAAGVRKEWDSFDLKTPEGIRVEVKSAAYLQSWAQRSESAISFDIRPTVAWDEEANAFAPETDRRRQADVYVFALLAHRAKRTLNPLNVAQWTFFVLSSARLDAGVGTQKSITLAALAKLEPERCTYAQLAVTIRRAQTAQPG